MLISTTTCKHALRVAMLCIAGAGCSEPALAPSDVQFVVRNTATDTVAFFAFDRQASNLIDPNGGPLAVTVFGKYALAPGASVSLAGSDIDGFRTGAAVRFFLYRVRGGQARLITSFDAAGPQRSGRLARIDLPPLPTSP